MDILKVCRKLAECSTGIGRKVQLVLIRCPKHHNVRCTNQIVLKASVLDQCGTECLDEETVCIGHGVVEDHVIVFKQRLPHNQFILGAIRINQRTHGSHAKISIVSKLAIRKGSHQFVVGLVGIKIIQHDGNL